MSEPRQFLVIGPQRSYVEPVLDDGSGPRYEWRDVYRIEAPTRHKAKWVAFGLAKANHDLWYTDLGTDHPLAGVTTEDVTDTQDDDEVDWPVHLRGRSDA